MTQSPTSPSGKIDVQGLIERVERATGPDRELDIRIEWTANGASFSDKEVSDVVSPFTDEDGVRTSVADQFDLPRYTASIDAALALTERVLPGWCWGVGNASDNAPNRFAAQVRRMGIIEPDHRYHFASTPALAILLATLRALQAQGETE